MKIFGMYEVGYMQACRVAAALGDYELAEQYAKAALGRCGQSFHASAEELESVSQSSTQPFLLLLLLLLLLFFFFLWLL